MTGTMTGAWTEQEDRLLKEGRAAGYSFGQIAGIIGRARNACIDRANRLGLVRQPAVPRAKAPSCASGFVPVPARLTGSMGSGRLVPGFASGFAPRMAKPQRERARPERPAHDLVPATVKGWPKPMTATAVDMSGLTLTTCRMPLWGEGTPLAAQFYCCAAVAPASSWCPACHKAASDPASRIHGARRQGAGR